VIFLPFSLPAIFLVNADVMFYVIYRYTSKISERDVGNFAIVSCNIYSRLKLFN